MKKALVFRGGWRDHDPIKTTDRFSSVLKKEGYTIDIFEDLSCLNDREKLLNYDLIIPCITNGEISREQVNNISYAISRGVGMGGWHGGMCDTFRSCTEWHFLTGGQWVAHPGNDKVKYIVNIISDDPIVKSIKDFEVSSEQYYLHVDPSNEVLATTHFPNADGNYSVNKPCEMPVVWKRYWGDGKIFYCSLGHNDEIFEKYKEAELITLRGLIWATR